MASSQVEMASSAPFGCVLRDHNRRDRCRERNARATQAAFQKNLNSLVRNHLTTCISVSSISASSDKESNNSKDRDIENVERDGGCSTMSPRQSRVLDRQAARRGGKEGMAMVDRQSQEAELMSVPNSEPSSSRTSTSLKETLFRTDSLARIYNLGVGASSLVQIWEKRLNQSNSFKMSSNGSAETSRSNSGFSCNENENIFNASNESSASNESIGSNAPVFEKQSSRGSEAGDSVCVDERYDTGPVAEDSFGDTHSEESTTSDALSNLDAREREREREKVRVADIIKRLKMTAQCPLSSSDDNDQQSCTNASPSRERDHERLFGSDQTEQLHKGFSQVISSPRMIRGRQAFADLLMHLERDRHRELDALVDRRAVSRFSHKGRIQSMLRLKLLQRRMAVAVGQDVPRRKPATSQVNKLPQGSAIMHLRERFSTGVEQASTDQSDAAIPKSPQKEVVKNTSLLSKNSSTPNKPSKNTLNRDVDRVEQKNATGLQTSLPHASEDLREEVCMSSKVTCQETSSVATNTSTQASNGLHEEGSPSSKVTSEGTSSVATNNFPNASEDLRDEASPSSKVAYQGSSPMARNTTTHASEGLHEEANPSLKVTLQRTSLMARSTSPHGSEDLCEEASPSSEVTLQGTSPMARNTSPHVSEDLHEEVSPRSEVTLQGTSSEARNNLPHASEHLHEEASPSSEIIWQGTSSEARNNLPHVSEDLHEEASLSSDVIWQGTSSKARNLDAQENADATTSLVGWGENEIEEQLEDDYQYYGDYTYDWINEISRPRSYWENLRKAWYQEMLNSNSGKGEIRQLIERRTVSNCLASDFRDRIDRLMESRLEIQAQPDGSQEGEDDDISHDRMNQLMTFLQKHHQKQQQQLLPACSQEEKQQVQEQEHQEEDQNMTEEDDDDNDDEGGEERSLISAQYQEASDDFYQCTSLQPSPSHMTAWSYQDIEVGDDANRAASTSPPRHLPSHSYYSNSHQGSPSPPPSYHQNHHHFSSPEMEFIYDMRGQMEQVYREMSELRKVIKSCVDMQMVMQQSMKQEVHSGQEERKRSADGLPKKGNCCICHEVKVDSLLYRCGHMCTCLKCAHELQWNSGKCPICRAPIVDVVKAQMDY
ncbi:probable GPI-anchored adhesin-like protein PGA55 isoform X2 [Malus sylvestris]|uniref:probable GPI-anchored adhesin-like protein PGA55 isoform X2 n=1 Tax=Malus sylvestris TaxID=3752 RepID=UPI0021ABD9CE|nr:probable GPI-anchored adhesin-like protein PGA55 isoform X2 [Malus sylvestris]